MAEFHAKSSECCERVDDFEAVQAELREEWLVYLDTFDELDDDIVEATC